MAIEFTKSAGKHGFTQEEALSAIENATYVSQDFDRRGSHADYDTWAWVGPVTGGPALEVFAFLVPPDGLVIFHCMEAREKTIQRLRRAR